MSDTPQSTRREFLQGKSAADTLAELIAPTAADSLAEPSAAGYLLHLSRRAMACNFEMFFNAGQYSQATTAGLAALDLIDRLEDQLSIYRDHSEVSRLNERASEEDVAIEPGLFALLQTAARVHFETAGAYDITSGPLSKVWGFTRRAGAIPLSESIAEALSRVGTQYLKLDAESLAVHFVLPGMEINLGSIGKGYALDCAGQLLIESAVGDFLLHGGNSSVLARGSHGARASEGGWLVGVRHPLRPTRRLGQFCLRDRALATSGSGTQFFMHEGRRYGHILDPRSGWPAEGVLSACAIAPTAAEADALSTAFYVMGVEATAEYCRVHPQIGAVIVAPGPRAGSIETHLIGISGDDWTALDE